ncbi:TIR domain-containing protein [Pyxidicoccus fallax]|uniref:TIR domain-containing protein n=1 Tax=Pyxidicoccus fallax TaxID=394095 RepID=A0A848LEP2_9BACT|nr:TIR domain-containing protein [Pyxidicoccus fallax]NMO16946.1 TIR domain-containing protein [Pyxidicoccus fallax]NPC81436.1 TIR domain-containing protein [Pyxidicoccus fallax]
MFDVFLSHNGQDKASVEVLAERLRAEAGLQPFLDKWHLVPGTRWQSRLEEVLEQSQAVAVFFGPSGVAPWHDEEVRIALANAVRTRDEYRVIPVLLPGARPGDVTGFLAQRTWVDFRAGLDDAAAFKRLVAGIKGQAPEDDTFHLPNEPAPYRGLLPFGKRHARFFFGREAEIETVLARLKHSPFVAVVGASGVGKSSLVLAGVLPRLEASGMGADDAPLRARLMTPGSRPLRALADQLATLGPPGDRLATAEALHPRLVSEGNAFRTALSTLTADQPGPFLLVVDQLEELFTHSQDGSLSPSATSFLANLRDAVEHGRGAIRVIVTLRADFFERCLRIPTLRALLQDHEVLLGSMDPEALRDAIIRPAQAVGAFLEKGLVSAILKDVSHEPGSLPLLEHALYELWRARSGAWLTLSAYEASGGVAGALQWRAQACYEALSATEQELAKRLFLRLTTLGEGTPDTRRRILYSELRFPGVDAAQVEHVLQALSGPEARLLVVREDSVEVAHEVLIQTWSTLRGWLDENRRVLGIHRRLTEATNEWAEHQRDASYLYTGSRLLEAEECFSGSPGPLNDREHDFLAASVELRDEEKRAEERHRQAELEHTQQLARVAEQGRRAEAERARVARRATQRLRVLALVLMVGTGAIFSFWRQARQERDVALSRELTANALLGLKEDPQRSLLLIQQAHRIAPTEHVERALSAWQLEPALLVLRDTTSLISRAEFHPDGTRVIATNSDGRVRIWDAASGRTRVTLSGHTGAVRSARFNPEGTRALTASKDGTARIWDVASGELLATLSGHTDAVWDARFSPDGSRIVTASRDGTVRTWDAASGRPLLILTRRHEEAAFAMFSPDSTRVITASSDGAVRIRDAQSGRLLVTLSGHRGVVREARFNPKATHIVTAGQDGTARLWNAASGRLLAILSGHGDELQGASFSSDGTRIVTASMDGTARIWNAHSGEHLVTLVGHTGPVAAAAFRPDGARVVTASADGTARIWDVASGQLLSTLSGHTDAVWDARFSPDGRYIVTSSLDGTARLWSASGKISTTLPGTVVEFSPDRAHVATASDDGPARLWDAASGRPLVTFSGQAGPVLSVNFNPDGTRVVTTGQDGTARIWDAASGRPLVTLSGHTDAVWDARFSRDGARIVTASMDGTARVWNAATGKLLVTLSGYSGEVWGARFSDDGARIVTAHMDDTARVWDATTGRLLVTLSGHTGLVSSASFSPDGRRVVTASMDGTARIWDAATGRRLVTLSGYTTGPVYEARFSADGTRVVTTYQDDTPCLWDAASGQLLARPFGEVSLLRGAMLNPDGSRLFTEKENGTIRIWTHRLWEPLEVQLSNWSAGRELTCEEHALYLHARRDCPNRGSTSEEPFRESKTLTASKGG